MTCELYNISADARQIDKVTASTSHITKQTIRPTDAVDIITPTFLFDYDVNILGINYLKCNDFGRYYFVTNIAVENGGRVRVSCSIDVLQTYADSIRNCKATVIRTATSGAPTMYSDSKFPVYPSKKVVTSITSAETSNSLSANGDYCYVLNTIGSSAN